MTDESSKLTRSQVQVLRLLLVKPRTSSKNTHHDQVSGHSVSKLVDKGLAARKYQDFEWWYSITDAGREALKEAQGR